MEKMKVIDIPPAFEDDDTDRMLVAR